MAKRTTQEPWKRANPRKTSSTGKGSRKLTAAQKAEARGRARKAGRKYPNLVDNMAVARKRSAKKKSDKRTAKKGTAQKSTARKLTTAERSTKTRTAARKRR